MAKPFRFSPETALLNQIYPTADEIASACQKGGRNARLQLSCLWLSEGIPFAFQENPALYESIRFWIGHELDINSKEISLLGSGRIGQALNPNRLGKPFGEDSDLDFFAISKELFDKLKEDFKSWARDYEDDEITPSEEERRHWKDNLKVGPDKLQRGFIDVNLIPSHNNYKYAVLVKDTMRLLHDKLKVTTQAPRIKQASIRVYRDWNAFIAQLEINLGALGALAKKEFDTEEKTPKIGHE